MAVAGLRPGFWLQHACNEARQLVAFADELAQSRAGRPGVSFGPVNVPGTLNTLFQQARLAGDAIMDPHGHFLDRDTHPQRSHDHFPWLVPPRPTTQAQWEAWMQAALDHQQSADLRGGGAGPSFVSTASPTLTVAGGTDDLYAVHDAAVAVRSRQQAGVDCWMGIAVERTYLREEPHLTRLANSMVTAARDGVVFRASHNQLAPVDDRQYLAGLREIVEAAAGNGIRIFLPNSGWLGWLAMAWAAWGFAGGMAAGTWVDRRPGPMNRPERPSEPYFERQLLRTVPWRVHEQLVNQPGYQQCTCADCTQMGTTHDASLAKRHQIRQANDEAFALTSLPAPQRRAHVRAQLDQAIAFRDSLPDPPRSRVGGDFLDRWRDLV